MNEQGQIILYIHIIKVIYGLLVSAMLFYKKLAIDVDTDAVEKRVADDEKEAQKFGFQGTPGFLLNGIPVKGAYPTSYFVEIIGELQKSAELQKLINKAQHVVFIESAIGEVFSFYKVK